MKKWTTEVVHIVWEDGQKKGLLYQNGEVELYKLKKANKSDVVELLEIEEVQNAKL